MAITNKTLTFKTSSQPTSSTTSFFSSSKTLTFKSSSSPTISSPSFFSSTPSRSYSSTPSISSLKSTFAPITYKSTPTVKSTPSLPKATVVQAPTPIAAKVTPSAPAVSSVSKSLTAGPSPVVGTSISSILAKPKLTVAEANQLGMSYGANSNLFASSDVSAGTITPSYAISVINKQTGKNIDPVTGLNIVSGGTASIPAAVSKPPASVISSKIPASTTPAPVSSQPAVVTKELSFNLVPTNVPLVAKVPATVTTEPYKVTSARLQFKESSVDEVLKTLGAPAAGSNATPNVQDASAYHIDPNKVYVHKNGLVDVGSGVQERINMGGNPSDWTEKDTNIPLVPPSATINQPSVTPGTLNQTMLDKSLGQNLNQVPSVLNPQPVVNAGSSDSTIPVAQPLPFDTKVPENLSSSPGEVDLNKPPETVEEIKAASKIALDKYNPDGISNGDNKLISEYYPKMAGPMIQGVVKPHDVAETIRTYEALRDGDATTIVSNPFAYTPADFGGDPSKPFNELTEEQQKARLAMMWKTAMINGAGMPVAAAATRSLIENVPNPTNKKDLLKWSENGGLDDVVNSDLTYKSNRAIIDFVSSPAGQATIGGAVTAIGIGATIASGGSLAAAGMVGFGIFGVTEIPNYFQASGFLNKQSLQTKGQYAPDKAFDYEQKVSSTKDLIKDLNYNQKTLNDEARKTELAAANESYKNLGKSLADNWNFLESQGAYDQKLQEYKDLGAMLNQLNSAIDPATGTMITTGPTSSTTTIIPPTGGRIEIEGVDTRSGEPVVLTKQGSGVLSFKVYDKDGNLVKTDDSQYWDGQVNTLDYTNELAFKTQVKDQSTVKESTIRPVTLYVAPGQTAEMLGKTYYGGTDGISYLVQAPVGTQASIKFSSPGQDSDVLNTMVQDQPTQIWYKELSDSFKPYVAPTSGIIDFNLKPNQQLILDGEPQDPKYNQLGRIIPAGAHSAVVKEEGKDDVVQTIFVDAGKETSFSVQGKDVFVPYQASAKEPFVPYQKSGSDWVDYGSGGGGSGGGGGGSYGGSYGGSSSAETLIVFGESLTGARIWLDTVEIAPVIGTAYSTTPGYHAFKATKDGYKDYEKTLYAMDGQTLHVDVVFVEGSGSGSGSTGTLIIFGTSLAGSRIWLDDIELAPEIGKSYSLTPGYHAVKATKEGYEDFTKSVYISEDSTISVDAVWTLKTVTPTGPKDAYVVFGAATLGAFVYIDEVLSDVVVGTQYSMSEGYHGIKMTKTNYADWIKTVYLAAGDTLTVSPVFEPLPVNDYVPPVVTPSTSKRVFINSDVPSAKIILNGGFTGQWTPAYVDLEPGLYALTCQKTGYDDYNTYVYVGDTIAFGETALALAQIAGLEVPSW